MDIKLSRIAGPIIAHRGACMDYPENTIADETVPLLTTALDTCLAHDIALVLEIKATWGWDAEDALVVADVVNDRWPHDSANLVVTSFSAPAIAAFAKRVPWARCGLATLAPPRDPAALMRDLGIVAVHLDYHYLGPGDVDRLRDAGAEVAVATVNDAAIGQGLLDAGAQGLITDHPRLL